MNRRFGIFPIMRPWRRELKLRFSYALWRMVTVLQTQKVWIHSGAPKKMKV